VPHIHMFWTVMETQRVVYKQWFRGGMSNGDRKRDDCSGRGHLILTFKIRQLNLTVQSGIYNMRMCNARGFMKTFCLQPSPNQWHWHLKYANKDVNPGFMNIQCETPVYKSPRLIVT